MIVLQIIREAHLSAQETSSFLLHQPENKFFRLYCNRNLILLKDQNFLGHTVSRPSLDESI